MPPTPKKPVPGGPPCIKISEGISDCCDREEVRQLHSTRQNPSACGKLWGIKAKLVRTGQELEGMLMVEAITLTKEVRKKWDYRQTIYSCGFAVFPPPTLFL